jgi:hypothetical protein
VLVDQVAHGEVRRAHRLHAVGHDPQALAQAGWILHHARRALAELALHELPGVRMFADVMVGGNHLEIDHGPLDPGTGQLECAKF